MHSWRDDVSPDAQAEMDRLLDSALRVAQSNLAQAAEFEPFAIVMDNGGRVMEVGLDTSGLGKHPESDVLIDNAARHLRQARDVAHCTALVINTRLSKERTDAVEIRLEHKERAALVVLLRYKRATFGNKVDYGDLSAFSGKHDVWA